MPTLTTERRGPVGVPGTAGGGPRRQPPVPAPPDPRLSVLRTAAVAGLLGAEYIHWSVIDLHAREWPAAGVFFTAAAAAEVLLAIAIVLSRRLAWLRLAIVANLTTIGVWAAARTTGLPFGPAAGRPEPVGRADLVAVVLEVLTVVAAVLLVRRPQAVGDATPSGRRPWPGAAAVTGIAVYVAGLTAWGLAPVVSGSLDAGAGQPSPATIVARDLTFNPTRLELPAGRPLELRLENQDVAAHNLAVHRPGEAAPAFRGKAVPARSAEVFGPLSLPAGHYEFRCDLHPSMRGVLTVSAPAPAPAPAR